ncbi:MAG TPA: magnesium transporter [Candidatus Paceibacterota bacterium]|nr:magnesium transporter [Candidatus Paceibacterota bacterium]HMO82886.1 magnesium transporter [Candidatus Paceibacterota bacterium]
MAHLVGEAGRLLTNAVPIIYKETTIGESESLLRSHVGNFETINYLYVVSKIGELLGVISIKELLRLPAGEKVSKYMKTEIVTARSHTKQERIAQLALSHNLKAIPILSKEKIFLGVVPSDKILTILNQEHTEDVLRFAGVHGHIDVEGDTGLVLANSPIRHIRSRLPWLVLGLFGGVGAAVVIRWFEATLAEQLILAAFIPAIVYMADAVGSQTQMLFIRALALDHQLKITTYLRREFVVNLALGGILALLTFGLSMFWLESTTISLILSISIFLTVGLTVIVGVVLPWVMYARGHDPAVASGPLATVIRDITSLCIYLGVAASLL